MADRRPSILRRKPAPAAPPVQEDIAYVGLVEPKTEPKDPLDSSMDVQVPKLHLPTFPLFPPPQQDLWLADRRGYVERTSDAFIVDQIKVWVAKVESGQKERVYLSCPLCNSMETYTSLGRHMGESHGATHLTCPGVNCYRGKQVSLTTFASHLRQYHFCVQCVQCGIRLDALKLAEHRLTHDPDDTYGPPGAAKKPVNTILEPRILPNGNMALAQPIEGPTFIKEDHLEEDEVDSVDRATTAQILIGGKVIIVDGVQYYVRNQVPFVDCPLCSDRSMAMSVLDGHLVMDHGAFAVRCPSTRCGQRVSADGLVGHLLAKHGHVRCDKCAKVVPVPKLQAHLASECGKEASTAAKRSKMVVVPQRYNDQSKTSLTYKPWPSLLERDKISGKLPTVPCPYCHKECTYLNKHIRDVHQPKVTCPVCQKQVGKSYLTEHLKVQHLGKEVPTKKCPMCGIEVQKIKNHFKYQHGMTKDEANQCYSEAFDDKYLTEDVEDMEDGEIKLHGEPVLLTSEVDVHF